MQGPVHSSTVWEQHRGGQLYICLNEGPLGLRIPTPSLFLKGKRAAPLPPPENLLGHRSSYIDFLPHKPAVLLHFDVTVGSLRLSCWCIAGSQHAARGHLKRQQELKPMIHPTAPLTGSSAHLLEAVAPRVLN